jgi:hypothetical protein
VDSGDDTTHVYQFCLRYGFNAIKGESRDLFQHDDGSRRIFSQAKPLHLMIGAPSTCESELDEPEFWLYSKSGIRERLNWLRTSAEVDWETPSDVSDDYRAHMDSERLEDRRVSGSTVKAWVQYADRNDLFVCEGYQAMMADMVGVIGEAAASNLK